MKIWQILLAINQADEKYSIMLDKYLDFNTPESECKELYQDMFVLERMAQFNLKLLNQLTNGN